jgi:hypothetical protein
VRSRQQRNEFNEFSRRSLSEQLMAIRCRGRLTDEEQALICVVSDEIDLLPLFFEHYRKLGVTRFFMIDKAASDVSRDFLLAQRDADVFVAEAPSSDDGAGRYWVNGIAHEYCQEHWILRCDADELLVYDGMEDNDIRHLTRWLDSSGLDRLFAPLLDIYPSGGVEGNHGGIGDTLRADSWFDQDGYALSRVDAGWNLSGGPRQRLFGAGRLADWPTLSKYPLIRMSSEAVLFDAHWLWPYDFVTEGPQGALLHLKLIKELGIQQSVLERQSSDPVAIHAGSCRYRGPKSLVRKSFMLPIEWDKPGDRDALETRRRRLRPPAPERGMWLESIPEAGDIWTKQDEFNRISHSTLDDHLDVIRCRGPLAPGEIALVSVVRNEAERLPLFFEHYRKLGVTRFFMVDNNSDDGSRNVILAEPLADAFLAHASYAEGLGGVYWANGIAREFCRGCWTVRADADELLVYDRMEERGLAELARWLQARDLDRLFALMIDLYPSGEIGNRRRPIGEVLESDAWFDNEGYSEERRKGGWLVTGGPRHRLFNQGPETHQIWLSKYPFFHVTPETTLIDAHFLWPIDACKPVARGALLHLKVMDDFRTRSSRFEQEGQHARSSRAYRIINERLLAMSKLVAVDERSRRYEGTESLLRHGVMAPIEWYD